MRTLAVPAFAPLDQSRFLALVSDAFRHRRKQLRGALGFEAGLEKDRADEALRAAGIEPTRRPEELSLAEWVALAKATGRAARSGSTGRRRSTSRSRAPGSGPTGITA